MKLRARWQALSPREQRSVSGLGVLFGLLLFGAIAMAPALHTLRDSDHRRVQLGEQQTQMLALQAQAKALQTRTSLSRDEALRTLQSLTPNTQMQLNVQGDRVAVQLKAVPAPTLANWVAQARSQAQALPVEAHLTRSNTTGTAPATTPPVVTWDGSMVLRLPTRGTTP